MPSSGGPLPDVTVQLDANGNGSTTAWRWITALRMPVVLIYELSRTAFTCTDVVDVAVVLTVTDVNDNPSTCNATVTVEDNVPPVARCQDVTVQLDGDGAGSTTAAAVNGGSTDACGLANLSLDQTDFDCSQVGSNTVTLTVTDNNGNTTTCSATVTVEDNVAPVATCTDITVQLDASGSATLTAGEVDNGSSDACGIQSAVLSRQSFGCVDVGANTVTLTVTDENGNTAACPAKVTVVDSKAPAITCPANIVVGADPGQCSAVVAYTVNFTDNCLGGSINQTAGLGSGAAFPIGTTTESYTATDAAYLCPIAPLP
ncbi:MAG: HYR domain-containing protein [Lewinellaceae bacterium]|nr:HYR domain-containing protein [Lewinellaceae bacterium]